MDIGEIAGVDVFEVGITLGVEAAGFRLVAELGVFEEGGDGVETEAGYAAVEPEAHGVEAGFLDGRVAPVEVGLLNVELVIVELVDRRDPLPCGAAEDGDPVVGRDTAFMLVAFLICGDVGAVGGDAVVPDVPIMLGVGAGAGGFDEPLVLVGGVVEDHVQDDADVALLALGDEVVHVGEGAVLRVNGLVVGDVVAEVDLGGRVHGRDPDGVDAEGFEVAEALGDAVEVANAVAVGVLKAARVDLVEDGMFPPGAIVHSVCGGVSCFGGLLRLADGGGCSVPEGKGGQKGQGEGETCPAPG